jgi:hypothetical protein
MQLTKSRPVGVTIIAILLGIEDALVLNSSHGPGYRILAVESREAG